MTHTTILHEHALSPAMVHPEALAIVRAFHAAGHRAWITGGSVRDLLLREIPRDIDIATTAPDDELRAVLGGDEGDPRARWVSPVKVTVPRDDTLSLDVLPMADPPWVPEDVWRVRARSGDIARDFAGSFDFTVNALLYDPIDDVLVDHVGGLDDLAARSLRRVDDRFEDFAWDALSIVRGVALGARLGFTIEPRTRDAMASHADALRSAAPTRLASHLVKILASGRAARVLPELAALGALDAMFPTDVARALQTCPRLGATLDALDAAPKEGASVAALLVVLLCEALRDMDDAGIDAALRALETRFAMPRRVWRYARAALVARPLPDAGGAASLARIAALAVGPARTSRGRLLVGPEGLEDALVARFAAARRTLDVMVYQFDREALIDALVEAAARGVAVRVLLDGRREENVATRATLTEAGVAVALAPARFPHAHAKVLLVDDEALVLSANLNDESMDAGRNVGVVVGAGVALDHLRALFACDWSGDGDFAPDDTPLLVSPHNARPRLLGLLDGARARLDLAVMTLSDPAVLRSLVARARAGVPVRVLLADPAWLAENESVAALLTSLGVEARFLTDYDLHAKVIVADDAALFGSINLSSTALDLNREVGLVVDDEDTVAAMVACFEDDWASAVPYAPAR